MRLIHSADWQLGARFTQFGGRAEQLREARLTTLQRALDHARQAGADAFLIAGDLFEDNQVSDELVRRTAELLGSYGALPVFILPGNHDPFTGPDCVWQRAAFAKPPANVRVLAQAGVVDLDGAFLLAAPLHQKKSTIDPSLKLVELARPLPAGTLKIGLTHGALAIEGKHQANDFPIALNAASRAGLDYMAIGHWHNWLADLDGGRIVMPGTPEPDAFHHAQCGCIAEVELAAAGSAPKVKAVPVATLGWHELTLDLIAVEASRAAVEEQLRPLLVAAERTVVRARLTGAASPTVIAAARGWIETALRPFLASQVADESSLALSSVEWADLRSRHPILSQVLADLDQLERLATGAGSSEMAAAGATTAPLTLADARALLEPAKIELEQLSAGQLALARQLLMQSLQEAAA